MNEEEALGRRLEERPRSIAAHLAMADFQARSGKDQLAITYYRTALRLADYQELDSETELKLAAGRAALARLEAAADARRETRLKERGILKGHRSARFQEALDVAAGRLKAYVQEPTAFSYPGLPSVQFFDPAEFPWAGSIEAATGAIREELLSLLSGGGDEFRPYVQHNSVAPEANKALLGKRDWSILGLCENGWVAPGIVERCPRTWDAILKAPLPRIAGWGPTIVFSMLKAGARIAPHTGMFNTRLVCHLPLIVPPGCGFRVGNQVRQWEMGKLLIFDDTIEHEAWNDSDEDRIVLIFDIWRPELSEEERYQLTALFSD